MQPRLKAQRIAPGVYRVRGNLCHSKGRFGPCNRLAPRTDPRTAARAQERQAQRQAQRQAVIDAMADQDAGLSPSGSRQLLDFADGGALDPAHAEGLARMGLVEIGRDGAPRLTATGRAAVAGFNRGDARAVIDAVNRGTDRQARRQEQAAAQQERAAAREAARQQREAARQQREQERQQRPSGGGRARAPRPAQPTRPDPAARAAETASRVNLPAAHADALRAVAEGQPAPEDARSALARLGLVTTSGPVEATDQGRRALAALERGDVRGYQAALQDARARLAREQARAARAAARAEARATRRASFQVFKSADGRDRWATITTTAYQDRDGEWLSRQALKTAVELADTTGQRGPLRYWHVPGVDLGDCDWQALVCDGRVLIESGTFRSPELAAIGAKAAAAGWQMSPGFLHPRSEPRDGVYSTIVLFERSMVPPGRAANIYTRLLSKESRMLTDEKRKAAAALGLNEELLTQLLAQATATDKTAQEQTTYKDAPAWAVDLAARLAALEARSKAETTEADEAATEAERAALDLETPERLLTDADVAAVAEAVAAAMVVKLEDLSKRMAELDEEMKTRGYQRMKDASAEALAPVRDSVQALAARVATLEGEQPAQPAQPAWQAGQSGVDVTEAMKQMAGYNPDNPYASVVRWLDLARVAGQ